MKPPLPISVLIVTLNEQANLPRCLESVRGLVSEIIVMDSGSTDDTKKIACEHHAKWIEQPWLGVRDQKNAALAHCTQPWVLVLDADEELSPALRREVEEFFATGLHESHGGASFPRKVRFLGRWITHGDWYPDRKLRLARRDGARFSGSYEHDKMEIPPTLPIREMKSDLHHYSFPNINRYIEKINFFGDAYVQRQLEAGKRWSLFATLFRPCWRFFRAYLLRRGFLDGFPGLWIAIATAFQTFIRHSRLYEEKQRGHQS